LNYVEYDPTLTQTNKKKILTKNMKLDSKIIGVSPNLECVLTLFDDEFNP